MLFLFLPISSLAIKENKVADHCWRQNTGQLGPLVWFSKATCVFVCVRVFKKLKTNENSSKITGATHITFVHFLTTSLRIDYKPTLEISAANKRCIQLYLPAIPEAHSKVKPVTANSRVDLCPLSPIHHGAQEVALYGIRSLVHLAQWCLPWLVILPSPI